MRPKPIAILVCAVLLSGTQAHALDINASAPAQAAAAAAASTTTDTKTTAKLVAAKDRAKQEIARRMKSLSELLGEVQEMKRLTADQKTRILSALQAELTTLTGLSTKIDTDAALEALRADIRSITQSYRIFALVIPKGRIEVAADDIKTATSMYREFIAKLSIRIAELQAGGMETASLSTSLSAMGAKISDADLQADQALFSVASLQPHGGDKAIMQGNDAALKAARSALKTAIKDLHGARSDAQAILQGLKDPEPAVVSATSTVGDATTSVQ